VFPTIFETSRLAPLSEEITTRRAELHKRRAAVVAAAITSGDLHAILPIAQLQAKRMGLEIEWDSDDGAAALEACLQAYARAKATAVTRDAGGTVETPELPEILQEPVASPSTSPRSLDDVVPEWTRYRRAKPNAIARTKYALSLLKKSGQLVPLADITRRHGREFHAWLSEDVQGLTDKTAKNHVDCVRALLQVATVELEWIGRNPWQGMELPVDDSVDRPPWTPGELGTLVAAPLFQQFTLPSVARAGGPAAYWMPLMGLYSGARIGELGQLEVADILSDETGHWFSIHKRVAGSVLKTKNSERIVAVHSELVRLGFMEYVENLRAAKEAKLFPLIPRTASRSRGDNFSQWFGQFRRAIGVDARYPDFHSFRHNARQAMRDSGIDSRLADAVTGHASKGGTGDLVYARSVAPAAKRSAVEAIHYPGLDLPKVFTT
jgi:integrase